MMLPSRQQIATSLAMFSPFPQQLSAAGRRTVGPWDELGRGVVPGPDHREVALPLFGRRVEGRSFCTPVDGGEDRSTSRFIASGPRWEVSRKVLQTSRNDQS